MAEQNQRPTLGLSGGKVQSDKPAEAGELVTYLPDPGDPVQTVWGGHTFHANLPLRVTNKTILDSAAHNRFFKVGVFNPGDAVETVETGLPKTPEQYRAHAISWLKTMKSVDDLDRKWQGEETLRIACDIGSDDLDLLNDIFGPLRSELQKRDQGR